MDGLIHCYRVDGLRVQTGDILCLTFAREATIRSRRYWRILSLLVPGEVDHVAIYVGPVGRCVEACARGVYTFDLKNNEWNPEKMFKNRGAFQDQLIGVAYPLHGLEMSPKKEEEIRLGVAAYCLSQVAAEKPYNLNLFDPTRDDAFYCSQLAYKAYLSYGINLNCGRGVLNFPVMENIIFPQEIWQGCYHQRMKKDLKNTKRNL